MRRQPLFLVLLALAPFAHAQRVVPLDQSPPPDLAKFNAALAKELDVLRQSDQQIRARAEGLGMFQGLPLPDVFRDEWQRIDHENLARLRAFIEAHGWPGRSVVGDPGAMAAFLVIQHSDLETQKEFLPVLQKAADEGELQKSQLVYLIDRVRIRDGGKQVYGTQIGQNVKGESVAENLEDPDHVDERRATVGLPPLKSYLESFDNHKGAAPGAPAPAGGPPRVDQALRKQMNDLHAAFRKLGPDKFDDAVTRDEKTWPAKLQEQRRAARERMTAGVNDLFDKHGFPGPALLGQDGFQSLFSVIQEVPAATQERALDLMKKAADAGAVPQAQLAWLTDNVRTTQGRPQLYGTQVERNPQGKIVARTLDDPAGVEQRRAAVGLATLDEFLAVLNGKVPERSAATTGPRIMRK